MAWVLIDVDENGRARWANDQNFQEQQYLPSGQDPNNPATMNTVGFTPVQRGSEFDSYTENLAWTPEQAKNILAESAYMGLAGGDRNAANAAVQAEINKNPGYWASVGLTDPNAIVDYSQQLNWRRLTNQDDDKLAPLLNNLAFLPHAMGFANLFTGGGVDSFLNKTFGGTGSSGATGGGMDWWNTDWGTEGLVDNGWTTDPRFNGTTVDFTTTRVGDAALPNVNTMTGGGVNMNDYYSMLDEIQAGTNGVTAPNPTVSIPGYGDVYGSPGTIFKSLVGSGVSPSNAMSLLRGALGGSSGSMFGNGGLNSLFGNSGSLLGAGLGGLLGMMNGTKKIDDAVTTESGYNPVLSPAAQDEMLKTIRGDYLNPDTNPWLKQTYDRAAGEIGARLSPSFGHMEAFGQNSGWQNAYGRSLADLGTSLYGGNYNQERNRQFGAANSAPNYMKRSTTPVYSNPMGGLFSGAMAGGLLGGKLFGG